jgi:hypothetical protein
MFEAQAAMDWRDLNGFRLLIFLAREIAGPLGVLICVPHWLQMRNEEWEEEHTEAGTLRFSHHQALFLSKCGAPQLKEEFRA